MSLFLRGRDVTVLKNGSPIGGVLSVCTQKKNNLFEVKEFFSNENVFQCDDVVYNITLKMCVAGNDFTFNESHINSIEIYGNGCCEKYYDCVVLNSNFVANGNENCIVEVSLQSRRGEFL